MKIWNNEGINEETEKQMEEKYEYELTEETSSQCLIYDNIMERKDYMKAREMNNQ